MITVWTRASMHIQHRLELCILLYLLNAIAGARQVFAWRNVFSKIPCLSLDYSLHGWLALHTCKATQILLLVAHDCKNSLNVGRCICLAIEKLIYNFKTYFHPALRTCLA